MRSGKIPPKGLFSDAIGAFIIMAGISFLVNFISISVLPILFSTTSKLQQILLNTLFFTFLAAPALYYYIYKKLKKSMEISKVSLEIDEEHIAVLDENGNTIYSQNLSEKALGTLSITKDITKEKESAMTLKESEERYRLLVENSPAGIITCDVEGNIITVNPAILKLMGSPSIEETEKINLFTFPSMVACGISKDMKKCLTTGKILEGEYFYVSKWGKATHIRAYLAPLHDSLGKVIGVQGIVEDFTEHKKTEDRFRTMYYAVEHSPVAVMIMDTKGNIEYVNPKYSQLTGYAAEDVLGQNLYILNSGEKTPEMYKELRDTINAGKVWRGEFQNKKKNGKLYWERTSVSPIFDGKGTINHFVAVKEDITERKIVEKKVNYLAYHDALTDLPNRVFFNDRLIIDMANAERYQKKMAIMYLDLDGFKLVNDTLGHDAGDELLKEAAGVLRSILGKGDTVARMGGDEFTLIFPLVDEVSEIEVIADKILKALQQPLTERKLKITTSIGIAFYPEHGTDIEVLLKNADNAMYKAKELGKNNYQIFKGDIGNQF